jgi:hypothetical protein
LALAAIYLSRVWVVGSVFAAALTVRTVSMPPAVAAQNIGVRPCRGKAIGDMLEAIARSAPLQPSEAMARIAPRNSMVPMVNNKYHLTKARFLGLDSKLISKTKIDSKRGLGSKGGSTPPSVSHHRTPQIKFSVGAIYAESACSAATFIVNSQSPTPGRIPRLACMWG